MMSCSAAFDYLAPRAALDAGLLRVEEIELG
jgi:hypothetical protein